MKTNTMKIAIVRLSALGDIINSSVVLEFLHKHFKSIEIDWICEEVFAPLLQDHPLISRVCTINLKEIKKSKSLSLLRQNYNKLKSLGDYDIVIDMQGLIKSAIVSRMISKNTHGFDKKSTRESLAALFYKTVSSIDYSENVVKRNCFVVSDALGFEITPNEIQNKGPIFPISKEFFFSNDKKNVVLVVGASWDSKIYPKEELVKVCKELKEQFYIVWGNKQEKADAEFIASHTKYATVAPQLKLDELVSFISQADLLIGNDTGPTHMAWAQNIPSITLLGPTTKRMIYETPINIGIKSPSKVDIMKIDKNDFSIKEISYKEIVNKAKELLYGV